MKKPAKKPGAAWQPRHCKPRRPGSCKPRESACSPPFGPDDSHGSVSASWKQSEPGDIVLYMRAGAVFHSPRRYAKALSDDELFLIARGTRMPQTIRRFEGGQVLGKDHGNPERAGFDSIGRAQTFAVSPDGGLHALPLGPVPARWAATMGTTVTGATTTSTEFSL